MKLEINTKEFIQALSKALSASSRKATLPIIENVLMVVEKEKITLQGTDLEITACSYIHQENSEEGSWVIDAFKLKEILTKLPDVVTTLEMEDTSMNIVSFGGDFTLPFMGNPADFPKVPVFDKELASIEGETDAITKYFGASKAFVGTDELRPIMNGVVVDIANEKVVMAATNSHVLIKLKTIFEAKGEDGQYVVPAKGAYLISKLKKGSKCKLAFSDKNLYVTSNNELYVIRLVEGKYPAYNSIIPKDFLYKVTVNREALYNAIDRVAVVSNSISNMMILTLEKDKVSVNGMDMDFNSKGNVSVAEDYTYESSEEKFRIGVNSVYLSTILSNVTHDKIEINLQSAERALTIHPIVKGANEGEDKVIKEALFLLMPMMITD